MLQTHGGCRPGEVGHGSAAPPRRTQEHAPGCHCPVCHSVCLPGGQHPPRLPRQEGTAGAPTAGPRNEACSHTGLGVFVLKEPEDQVASAILPGSPGPGLGPGFRALCLKPPHLCCLSICCWGLPYPGFIFPRTCQLHNYGTFSVKVNTVCPLSLTQNGRPLTGPPSGRTRLLQQRDSRQSAAVCPPGLPLLGRPRGPLLRDAWVGGQGKGLQSTGGHRLGKALFRAPCGWPAPGWPAPQNHFLLPWLCCCPFFSEVPTSSKYLYSQPGFSATSWRVHL